jgi:hypothetical protein
VHRVKDLCPTAPQGFLDYGPRFWLRGFHGITSTDFRRCGKTGNESLSLNVLVHADAENALEFSAAASPSVPLNALSLPIRKGFASSRVIQLELVVYSLFAKTEERHGVFGSGMHLLVGEDDQRFTAVGRPTDADERAPPRIDMNGARSSIALNCSWEVNRPPW